MIYWVVSCDHSQLEASCSKHLSQLDFIHFICWYFKIQNINSGLSSRLRKIGHILFIESGMDLWGAGGSPPDNSFFNFLKICFQLFKNIFKNIYKTKQIFSAAFSCRHFFLNFSSPHKKNFWIHPSIESILIWYSDVYKFNKKYHRSWPGRPQNVLDSKDSFLILGKASILSTSTIRAG